MSSSNNPQNPKDFVLLMRHRERAKTPVTFVLFQMAAAVAEEEARDKEEHEFNISFDSALAKCEAFNMNL